MNYYNPYYYTLPSNLAQPNIGILGKLFGKTGISISNFLNGTQKVLNIANQTIPLVKQVKPILGNAKTMFKVMNEFKKAELTNKPRNNYVNFENKNIQETNFDTDSGPTFFV